MPNGKRMRVNAKMPAGRAGATASGEYQAKNTRTVKIMIVNDMVEAISGSAMCNVSRSPPGLCHQFSARRSTTLQSQRKVAQAFHAGGRDKIIVLQPNAGPQIRRI